MTSPANWFISFGALLIVWIDCLTSIDLYFLLNVQVRNRSRNYFKEKKNLQELILANRQDDFQGLERALLVLK